MIVRKNLDPKIVFRIAWKRVLLLIVISVVATLAYHEYGNEKVAIDSLPASILGVALAFMIGFRVNSAYERWWEGRRLWGSIVNDSRSISRQVLTFLSDGSNPLLEADKKKFVYRQIAYVYALKDHLRKVDVDEIRDFLDKSEYDEMMQQQNKPLALLHLHAKHLKKLHADGYIEFLPYMQIDTRLTSLMDAQGGAERIKNTVFPRQYSYYTTYFVAIYSYLLPFIFVNKTGWLAVPFTVLIGFIFFALDSIARGIENPFENTYNDTPMNSICRTILGESNLPKAVEPINGFLY
jgi:ion channel-forming bestrophin family protein